MRSCTRSLIGSLLIVMATAAAPLAADPEGGDSGGKGGEGGGTGEGSGGDKPKSGDDDFDKSDLDVIVGLVKEGAEQGLQLRAIEGGKGTWEVKLSPKAKVSQYETVAFDSVEAGASMHVLGQRLDAEGSGEMRRAPEIIKVRMIVTGEGFKPPPITPEQAEGNLRWHHGSVTKKKTDREILLGQAVVRYGLQGEIVRKKQSQLTEAKSNHVVVAIGVADPKKKTKEMVAESIHILDEKIVKAKGYQIFLPRPRR